MRKFDRYLKNTIRQKLNETLDDKVNELYGKIKEMEMDEAYGDMEGMGDKTPSLPKGIKFGKKFKKRPSHLGGMTSGEAKFRDIMGDIGDEDDDNNPDFSFGDDSDLVSEGENCEQCGVGKMNEGECNECGYSRLNEKVQDLNRKNKFDYTESEHLKGGQKKLDKNKNRKETKEGKKFPDLSGDGKLTRKDILMGRGVKLKETIEYQIKDNNGDIIKLNEDDMIDLIQNIVNEENSKMKSMGKHRGLTTYEKAHKESGKENKDYMVSLEKKMKDYLKTGSKGKYDMNPDYFPMGNGELGEMDKKAYEISNEMEDFNYSLAGQNFPNSDGVQFDEKRMKKYYEGDSTTGNAPGGNALKSKSNKRFNELREKNTLHKIKNQSYKRVPQPVFDEKYKEEGKLNLKMETVNEKKINQLNEEFDRMKDLFSYNRKTQ